MSALPVYEIFAVRYAKQDQRDEGHMFLDGQHGKMISGLVKRISAPPETLR